jgi:hypothetical protein
LRKEWFKHHSHWKQGESLPSDTRFVAKTEDTSFGLKIDNWEASTLSLSYTRIKQSYFKLKIRLCKMGVLASLFSPIDYFPLLYKTIKHAAIHLIVEFF